eukprot:5427796-Pleurochrysis_carterae.AAC.2
MACIAQVGAPASHARAASARTCLLVVERSDSAPRGAKQSWLRAGRGGGVSQGVWTFPKVIGSCKRRARVRAASALRRTSTI